MKQELYFKNLTTPKGKIDVVLDTDAYNEIDDQFAISYMLLNTHKFNIRGICAAPFLNYKSVSVADGMLKGYDEILKLLELADKGELKKSYLRVRKVIFQMKQRRLNQMRRSLWQNWLRDILPKIRYVLLQ